MRRTFLFPLLMVCLLSTSALAAEVRIGVLAFQGAERAEGEWAPTLRYLSAALPQHAFTARPLDLEGLTAAVRRAEVDFVVTNPGHYVELEAGFGVSRIATLDTSGEGEPSRALASAVVVRADGDLQRLTDIRGKRLAAVSASAFGGFRLVWRELAERGIDPFVHASRLDFIGFPMERIVEAVARGEADAGIVRACVLEEMAAQGRVRAADLRVLEASAPAEIGCHVSTRLYPDWPFAKLAHTPDPLAKQVALALLSMPAEGGHAWTVPVDYQPVHDLFRALKVGPYEYLSRRSLADMLWDHWPWLLFGVLAVMWWIVHVARVEHLVRRRTEELKLAHAEARRRREEMEHGARLALLGEMASSLAHEINQPLAAITNYAKGCARRLSSGTDSEGVVEGLGLIATQAERAADIVRRIRQFVRKRVPEPSLVDLNEAVESALGLFHGVATRRGIRLTVQLATGLAPVLGDRILIEQVVLNLLQNAADAMAGLAVKQLDLATAQVGATVEVTVTDSGSGLSTEAREHLFEPFFTTKPEGLGLGLALSRSIAEAHGGRLWAENAEEGGARLRLVLPVHARENR